MSLQGETFQDDFFSAGSGQEEVPLIVRAFRGITDNNCTAHLEINRVWYSFSIKEIVMNDDGFFSVEAETINGYETVKLSSEAVDYIVARQRGEGYQEKMSELGFPNGHYGHRPYE